MRPKDRELARQLDAALSAFDRDVRRLPGIREQARRQALLEQIVESVHRIQYVSVVDQNEPSAFYTNPSNEFFDPLKAAMVRRREGQIDEAFWLVFVFVHFGRGGRTGWRLARDVYGRLGQGDAWTWARVSANPGEFRRWLAANQNILHGGDGIPRKFGNHRKYQSLDARSEFGTGAAFESYVNWVRPHGSHRALIEDAQNRSGNDRRKTFRFLYRSMKAVASFGRTARFDYVTMIGKLRLANVEPDSTYMSGATGPVQGARLLFGANMAPATLDKLLLELEPHLNLPFGMQVLEDALCNWQKSPDSFVPFRG